jgi:hypothetical protein
MSEADTQPVAPATEPAVSPAAEVASAQNPTSDLDALLSDFEAQTKPQPAPQPVATPEKDPEWRQAKMEIDAWRRERAIEKEKSDLANVIKEIKGEQSIPDYAIRGWLSTVAESDPRINNVWEQRQSNPAAAKKLIASLKAQFVAEQAKNKGPDPEATSDKMAVAAAVRGNSTKAPETPAPKYGTMNEAQFRAELSKFGL